VPTVSRRFRAGFQSPLEDDLSSLEAFTKEAR
jgi:hypothetical protein